MLSPEEADFFFGITWQHVVRNVVITLTGIWLGRWALKKYHK